MRKILLLTIILLGLLIPLIFGFGAPKDWNNSAWKNKYCFQIPYAPPLFQVICVYFDE